MFAVDDDTGGGPTADQVDELVKALVNNKPAIKLLRLFAEHQILSRAQICRELEVAADAVPARLGHITRAVRSISSPEDHWFHWLPATTQWTIGYTLRNQLRREFDLRLTDEH